MLRRHFRLLAMPASLAVVLLAACSQPPAPTQATRPTVTDDQMLASIQAAGQKDKHSERAGEQTHVS